MVCVCWGVGSGKITHLLEIHIKKFTSEILSSLLYENKGKDRGKQGLWMLGKDTRGFTDYFIFVSSNYKCERTNQHQNLRRFLKTVALSGPQRLPLTPKKAFT